MVEVSSSVELEAFEQIEAVPGRALLRIAAQIPPTLLEAGDVALNIGDGAASERLEQLPAPHDDSGILLAAFSVPAAVLERGVSFELEFADGSAITLPAPTEGTRKVSRPHDRRQAIAELEQQIAAERERCIRTEAEVEQLARARIEALARVIELEAEQHLAHDAEAELQAQLAAEAGERATPQRTSPDLEADLASARAVAARVEPLERQLVDTLNELTAVSIARVDAELAARTLAGELEEAREQARLAAEQARAEVERAHADALEVARSFEREAAAREEAERLVEAGQVRGSELEQLRVELDQVRSELLAAQGEAEHASTLAVQWQAVAERAKETATRALAEAQALRDGAKEAQADTGVADEAGPTPDDATTDRPEDPDREVDRRLAAEREVAERQAINREVLRRAARERQQRARRSAKRKLKRPGTLPSDPSAPVDSPGPQAARSVADNSGAGVARQARLSQARASGATATRATVRARDEQLALSAWVARLPLDVLLRTGVPVFGLMLAVLIASGAVHLGL